MTDFDAIFGAGSAWAQNGGSIGGGYSPAPAYTPPPTSLISNPYTSGPRPSTQGLQVAPTGAGGSLQSAPNYIPQMTNFMSVYRPGGTASPAPAPSGGEFYGEPEGMGRETQIDMGYSAPSTSYQMPGGTNPSASPYGLLGPGPTPYSSRYGSVGGAIGPAPGAAPAPAPPVSTGYTPPTTGVQMPSTNPYGALPPRVSTPAPAPSNPYGGIVTRPTNPYGDLSGTPPMTSPYGDLGGSYGPGPQIDEGSGRMIYTDRYEAPSQGAYMPPASNPYGDLSGVPSNPYGSIGAGAPSPYGSVGGATGPAPGRAPTPAAPVTTGYTPPRTGVQMPSTNPYGDLSGTPSNPYGSIGSGPQPQIAPVGDYAARYGAGVRSPTTPATYGGFNPDTLSDQIDDSNAYQHNWSWDGQDGALTPRTPTDQFGGVSPYAPAGTGGAMPPPPANYGALPRTITNQTTSPYVGQTSKFTNSVPQTGGYQSYGAAAAPSQAQAYTSRYGSASPPGLLGGGATLP